VTQGVFLSNDLSSTEPEDLPIIGPKWGHWVRKKLWKFKRCPAIRYTVGYSSVYDTKWRCGM